MISQLQSWMQSVLVNAICLAHVIAAYLLECLGQDMPDNEG